MNSSQQEPPELANKTSQRWGVKAWVLLALVLTIVGNWLWHNWGVFYEMFGTYPNPLHTDEYKLIDSGMWGPSNAVYWIDNETILFSAPVVAEKDKEPGSGVLKKFKPLHYVPHDVYVVNPKAKDELFVWKLGEKPRPYAVGIWNQRYFCLEDGIIKYSTDKFPYDENGKRQYFNMVGPFGQEKLQKAVYREKIGKPVYAPRNRCLEYSDEEFSDERMKDRKWVVSARKDYYLDFGDNGAVKAVERGVHIDYDGVRTSATDSFTVNLMKADLSEKVTFSIPFDEADYYWNVLSEKFDNAFYLWRGPPRSPKNEDKWKQEGCLPVWKIDTTDKKTKRFCIPYNKAYGNVTSSIELFATKKGLFFVGFDSIRKPLTVGLYKYDLVEPKRILAGIIFDSSNRGVKVSPDGCKIAFGHSPLQDWYHQSRPTNYTLKVLDLCSNSNSEGDIK